MNDSDSSHSCGSMIRVLSSLEPEDPFPRRTLLVSGALQAAA